MTVSTSTSRIAYTGNGVTTSFSVPFPFIQDDYLIVIRTVIATGVETILTLDSVGVDGYSVTGAGTQSGNVIVVTAPASTERLSIIRSVEATQEADFVANDPLPSEVIEDSLDKLTMLFGDLAGANGLSRVPILYPGDIDGSGRYNSNGNRYANAADGVDPSDLATVQQVVAAGSGNFIQAGTGAVIRTMQDKVRERISVSDFSSFSEAVSAIPSGGGTLVVTPGVITIDGNITIPANVSLEVGAGAIFDVSVGVTLTVLGEVVAGNFEIFDGDGTVNLDNSASEYNLAWFNTANGHINERWDFARRGMSSFRTKVIRFPKPREGQSGVIEAGDRLFWGFSDPIVFEDEQNAATIYVDCEFAAANDCDSFMLFDDTAKPENIYFYGPLQANVTSTQTVPVGIEVRSGSRISFFGNVVLNGFATSVLLGGVAQTGGVEDIYMPRTQFSFFSVAALDIYGTSASTVQNIEVGNLRATAAQLTGLPVVRMRGLLRDISIDNIYYATDVPKDGFAAEDAEDVVLIDSNAEGTIQHVLVGAIYQANANNGLRTQSAVADANRIIDVTVGRIFAKFNGSAADLEYCQRVTLAGIENRSDVTIASTVGATKITAGSGMRTLADAGAQTIVNGIATQARGAGLPPAPAVAWPLGTLIRETTDQRMYVRIDTAGVAADFLMVRGAAFKNTTANRPTLAAADAGQLYFDTTLDADGLPIWWTGTAWVDATGAVV